MAPGKGKRAVRPAAVAVGILSLVVISWLMGWTMISIIFLLLGGIVALSYGGQLKILRDSVSRTKRQVTLPGRSQRGEGRGGGNAKLPIGRSQQQVASFDTGRLRPSAASTPRVRTTTSRTGNRGGSALSRPLDSPSWVGGAGRRQGDGGRVRSGHNNTMLSGNTPNRGSPAKSLRTSRLNFQNAATPRSSKAPTSKLSVRLAPVPEESTTKKMEPTTKPMDSPKVTSTKTNRRGTKIDRRQESQRTQGAVLREALVKAEAARGHLKRDHDGDLKRKEDKRVRLSDDESSEFKDSPRVTRKSKRKQSVKAQQETKKTKRKVASSQRNKASLSSVTTILTDIEGTTTKLSFVRDILFPYSYRSLPEFVASEGNVPVVAKLLDDVRQELKEPEASKERLVTTLRTWIKEDRKTTSLKALQGLIWEKGYKNGDFTGHVYPDAHDQLRTWKDSGISLYVYSSGSVAAQKLLFSHSDYGNICDWFAGHFDTKVGGKKESNSYKAIAQRIRVAPEKILFLSDIAEELDAAEKTGMQTYQLLRDGQAVAVGHPQAATFLDIKLKRHARAHSGTSPTGHQNQKVRKSSPVSDKKTAEIAAWSEKVAVPEESAMDISDQDLEKTKTKKTVRNKDSTETEEAKKSEKPAQSHLLPPMRMSRLTRDSLRSASPQRQDSAGSKSTADSLPISTTFGTQRSRQDLERDEELNSARIRALMQPSKLKKVEVAPVQKPKPSETLTNTSDTQTSTTAKGADTQKPTGFSFPTNAQSFATPTTTTTSLTSNQDPSSKVDTGPSPFSFPTSASGVPAKSSKDATPSSLGTQPSADAPGSLSIAPHAATQAVTATPASTKSSITSSTPFSFGSSQSKASTSGTLGTSAFSIKPQANSSTSSLGGATALSSAGATAGSQAFATTSAASATSAVPALGATNAAPSFGVSSKAPAFGAPGKAAASPAFGATSAAPAFGAASKAPSFGAGNVATSAVPGFGATSTAPTSTPAFGATSKAPAFGATSSASITSAPAFGGAIKTPAAFGASSTTSALSAPQSAASASPFGAASTTPAFVAAAQAPAFGAPQSASAASPFGGATSSPFGATSAAPAFGATSAAPAFGATSAAPAFGAPQSAAAASPFGGATSSPFGATSAAPAFGATGKAPAFGATSAAPAFGATGKAPAFGATSAAPAFGATGKAPAFGATSAAPAFGATSKAPAFGAPQSAAVASPFGSGAQASPFATNTAAKSQAGFNFGNLGTSAASNTSAPFGSSGPSAGPFGATTNAAQPFGAQPSPFAAKPAAAGGAAAAFPFAGKQPGVAPFGGAPAAASPFAQGNGASAPSPFGNAGTGAVGASPFGAAKPSPFAAGNGAAKPFDFSAKSAAPAGSSFNFGAPTQVASKPGFNFGAPSTGGAKPFDFSASKSTSFKFS